MILLARHGETADNAAPQRVQGWRDPPLSPRGREQAHALARELEHQGLAEIWTSHLRRARDTAAILGEALELIPRVDERLAESRRGTWEGRLVGDIERAEPEQWQAWLRAGADFRFPGGESLAEHQQRVMDALADVAAGSLPALVVCHGGTIRCAAAYRHPRGLDAFHELDVPNASVITVDGLAPARR